MSRLWTVLAHPWHECYLDALPYLAEGGDEIKVVAPEKWRASTWRTEIVLGLAKCPPAWSEMRAAGANVLAYETENLVANGGHWTASYACRQALQNRPWLNYSRANARVCDDIPFPPRNGGPGRLYRHELAAQMPGRFDVLFAGSINARRAQIINRLAEADCTVRLIDTREPRFGSELEDLMRDSKVVLNLHYYEPGVFEVFRVAPAVARGHIVISEADPAGEGHDWCKCVPYENLVGEVLFALGRGPATVP